MDLKSITKLFSGSPFKPLLQHRELILEALLHLTRQAHQLSTDQLKPAKSLPWLNSFSCQLEQLEQEVFRRLQPSSVTDLSGKQLKNRAKVNTNKQVINLLQTQSSLGHQIIRLSQRLNFKSLKLPAEMIVPMNDLSRQFGQTVYQLQQGVIELEKAGPTGLWKQHRSQREALCKQLVLCAEQLKSTSQKTRHHACQFESHIDPVDVALLFLILDDISDLALWMQSLVTQLQS